MIRASHTLHRLPLATISTVLIARTVPIAASSAVSSVPRYLTSITARAFNAAPARWNATPATPAPAKPVDEREVRMTMYGNGFERQVVGHVGETLLNVAQLNDVDQIEGACEGCMCCSTCHMIFDEEAYKVVGPPPEDEQDLIDRAAGATDTSRLGCQVRVSKQLQGARIRIPSEFTNQMV